VRSAESANESQGLNAAVRFSVLIVLGRASATANFSDVLQRSNKSAQSRKSEGG